MATPPKAQPEAFDCPDCGLRIEADQDTCSGCLFFWPYMNAPSAAFLATYPN